MDPNEALRQLREVLYAEDDGAVDSALDRLDRAAELFVGLDAWLTKGGFLPDGWFGAVDAHAEVANFCPACGAHRKENHEPDCPYVEEGRVTAEGMDPRSGKRLRLWSPDEPATGRD